MRTILKCRIPVEAGNKAIKEGAIGRVLEAVTADLKPEATYFYAEEGKRTCQFVFDFKDPTDMPRIAERLFSELNAEIDMYPVMNLQELKTGLGKLK